jgi:hypothetical protein
MSEKSQRGLFGPTRMCPNLASACSPDNLVLIRRPATLDRRDVSRLDIGPPFRLLFGGLHAALFHGQAS